MLGIKEKELKPQFTASAGWNSSYEIREEKRRMEDLKARFALLL